VQHEYSIIAPIFESNSAQEIPSLQFAQPQHLDADQDAPLRSPRRSVFANKVTPLVRIANQYFNAHGKLRTKAYLPLMPTFPSRVWKWRFLCRICFVHEFVINRQ
jgi:hypothetical protein